MAVKTTNGRLNGFGHSVEAVKERVPIESVAAEYFEAKLSGPNRLLAHCPAPDHEDKTPSFTLFLDRQRFKCFGIGCGIAGDVVDLEQICGGHNQLWMAVVALSVRYGVELPARSETWKRWQDEKHAIENLAENIRSQVRARRMFKALILSSPEIQNIEDPVERREEIRLCWQAFDKGMRKVSR